MVVLSQIIYLCKSKNIYKASSTVRRSMMFESNINNVSKQGVWTSLADAMAKIHKKVQFKKATLFSF